jgi:hypothetical protein
MKFCTLLTLVHLSNSSATPVEIFTNCQVHITEIEARGGDENEIKRKRVECVDALKRVSCNIQDRLWEEGIELSKARFDAAIQQGSLINALRTFKVSNDAIRGVDMSKVSDADVTHIKDWITEEVCGPCLKLGDENITPADGKIAQDALNAGMARLRIEYADHHKRGEDLVLLKAYSEATALLLDHYRGFEEAAAVVGSRGITARLETISSLKIELTEVEQYISQLSL